MMDYLESGDFKSERFTVTSMLVVTSKFSDTIVCAELAKDSATGFECFLLVSQPSKFKETINCKRKELFAGSRIRSHPDAALERNDKIRESLCDVNKLVSVRTLEDRTMRSIGNERKDRGK